MTIIEQLARYLAAKLGLPFEGGGEEPAVFFGYLPAEPVKAVCVYASDLRAPGDLDGARAQVVIRSDADGAWPLTVAAEILRQLDERRDLLFTPGGCYVNRVETVRGFEFNGINDNDAQYYAAEFRVYSCGN